ncbi:MAG TPA: hypothetical protein VKR06_25270 [Ktedonosporobacter sp.]|nr:hypothetical protein [Ktedonosporobacter sp.]
MIVPIASLNQPALQSLAYARSITPDVVAVHVTTDAEETSALQKSWETWVNQLDQSSATSAVAPPPIPLATRTLF